MDPKGPVAADEKHLIFTALGLMLIVVIPVIIMTFAFAWKYRAGNKNATYTPKWEHSHAIELVVWTIPTVIIIMLGTIVWKSTHALTPEKPIASSVKPLVIEAVAMDWKWLFIYPEQGVATVNRLVIPAKTPITFHITSDTVMNSFFIPRLGSQIYAMAGMQTELNLLADKPGTYHGLNTQFSGEGFTSMHFSVHATYPQDFQDWVAQTKTGGNMLDAARFRKLETPDEPAAPILFSAVQPGLFQSILRKFAGGHEMSASNQNSVSLAQAQK
ncbi:MAG TPA: ubiquinol oxidase subunit II [Gallionellaceae bacterium]|nr:ubiquinol oxidase subunit II [Gallionellaceae bacterium]